MSLRLSLRDGEPVVVNGAVLRASGRTEFVVENQAAILRGREVMTPEEADTPARRLYFACMMAYIDEPNRDLHQDRLVSLLADLLGAIEAPPALAVCTRLAHQAALGQYYRALAECRLLIGYEAEVVARLQPTAA